MEVHYLVYKIQFIRLLQHVSVHVYHLQGEHSAIS